jgi:rare lipoprotein A (peptidoglycan hydrolase)
LWKAAILSLLFASCVLVYRHAETRPVTLLIDGRTHPAVTRAETVGQLLKEQGYYVRERDILHPARHERLKKGLVITLRRARPLFVRADGQIRLVYTSAAKTADLLSELGITMNGRDRVTPALQDLPAAGSEVTVTRINSAVVREEAVIPYATEMKNDPGMLRGRRQVLAQGKTGLIARTYEVTYADDKEESRRLLGEETLRSPSPRKVAVGTGAPLAASPVARGGPVVQTSQGLASWYGLPFHGRRTSYGEIFDKNALTAAHRFLPHNTRVRVTYLKTGRSVEVRVNDYGPHIPGRVIDLSQAAAKAIGLLQSGVGMVKLEVLR